MSLEPQVQYQRPPEDSVQHHQVELVPGTEILTDLPSVHFIHSRGNDVVLVPQPSSDVHDPLNWNRFWKYTTLVICTAYMFLGNFTALSIAPLTPVLMEEFDSSLSKVALLTGSCVLALGYANFIIIPCTNLFGRRPVALVCGLIVILSNIWQALATSYDSLIGARVVIGIGSATSESLMPLTIADVLFLHQRGTWMGVYFWAYGMGAYVGPIVSGNMAEHVSWRWFFWLSAILQGAVTVAMIFFFPETKFKRENFAARLRNTDAVEVADVDEKGTSIANETVDPESMNQSDPALGQGYPSAIQRWGLNLRPDMAAIKMLPRDIITPFQIAAYPIVIFAGCCLGFGANSLLVLNLLESPGFSRPPYNFKPDSVGFVNFALMAGAIFGLATAGPFSDWISMKLTKRNNGIREPEMRLLSFVPFLVLGFIGMLVASLGWEYEWPWEAIVVIGFGFTGLLCMSIPTIGITYAIDSYKPVAGQIMVVATVIKNTFGFGMTYFIEDWAEEKGWVQPVMTLAACSIGIPIIGSIIFWFFGKTMRRWTRDSKVHDF